MTIADHGAMTVTDSEATTDEARDIFARACQDELGISADEFLAAYDSDAIPAEWDRAAVARVEFKLPFVR